MSFLPALIWLVNEYFNYFPYLFGCGDIQPIVILETLAPVAQRIEHRPPEPVAGVRVSPGAPPPFNDWVVFTVNLY
jgi:hypothetical protein